MSEGTFLSGTTEMAPGQLIMLQPPSDAPKYFGILLIVYGAFQALGLLSLFFEPVDPLTGEALDYPVAAKMVDFISALSGLVGFIVAGTFLMRYEQRGVYLALGIISLQFVLSSLSFAWGAPDAGLGAAVGEATALGVAVGVSAVCSGICALIVAIPLMVDNNGLK